MDKSTAATQGPGLPSSEAQWAQQICVRNIPKRSTTQYYWNELGAAPATLNPAHQVG
jgi:hypothetical protein